MKAPVRRCSGPSSSRIAVPEAGQLPSTPRPVSAVKRSSIGLGKPVGKVGKAWSICRPHSSQWPVVVSLPALGLPERLLVSLGSFGLHQPVETLGALSEQLGV